MSQTKNSLGVSRRKAQTEATKQRVITAARKVFASYPYDAASIRMIGHEGGFNHSFIRYHFHTKARLFEAVSQTMIQEYIQASARMIEGAETGSLRENFDLVLKRFLDFGFNNPEALDILILNIGAFDEAMDAFPGIRHMRQFQKDALGLFTSNTYFSAPDHEIGMVFFLASIMIANCIGASWFYGKLLDLDPDSDQYREWVREMFTFLFYPAFKKLVFSGQGPVRAPGRPEGLRKKTKTPGKRIMGKARNVLSRRASAPALKKFLADLEKSAGKIKTHQNRQDETKGQATRRRIITVARRVFTRYPYNSASIRMIGEEGDFDFTLLYHYFPKKAQLFEAVVNELLEEYLADTTSIIKGLDSDSLRENVSRFINNTLDYFIKNPDVMRGSMQNIAQMDKFGDIPGFDHLTRFLTESLAMFREVVPVGETDERVRMWLFGFGTVIFSCVGAASYNARVLGMGPKSDTYRQWVKDCLMYVFYPSLKDLIFTQKEQ